MRNTLTLAVAGLACSGAAFAQTQVTPTPVSNPLRAIKTVTNTPAAGGNLLFDNGGPDGINGYSNATINAFNARRTLLDDFTVPAATTWDVGCLEWNHLWNTLPAGSGTGVELEIYNEAATGGAPDTTSSASGGLVNVCTYAEIGTGAVYFSRPEAISTANFDTVSLGAGTYWLDLAIGFNLENNFWLTAGGGALNGSECWVDYDDLGGLQPGSVVFGVVSDLAWKLSEGDCTNDRITVYCNPGDGSPNNTASISVSGNVLDGSDIDVCMTGGPAGQSAYLLVGNNNGIVNAPPGAKGDLCIVGGFIGRYALDIATLDVNGGTCVNLRQNAQTTGCPDYTVPNTGCAQQYQPGETWYFQFWHRQPMGQASTFSEAACVTFK